MRKISQQRRRVSSLSPRPLSQRRASLFNVTHLTAKISLSENNTLSILDLPALSFEDFIVPCLSYEPAVPATMDSLYAFEEFKGVDTPPVLLSDEGIGLVADLDTKWELSVDLQQLIDQSLKEDVGSQSPSQLFSELLSSQASSDTSERPADSTTDTADSTIDTADSTADNTLNFCVNVSTDHQMSLVGLTNENGKTILYVKSEEDGQVEETEAPFVDVEDISEDTQDLDYEPYSPTPSTSSRRYKAPAPSKSRRRQLEKGSTEYQQKRERNNIAVRKSRAKAKDKQKETELRVKTLTSTNEELQKKVDLLQKELNVLKGLFTNVGAALPHEYREYMAKKLQ